MGGNTILGKGYSVKSVKISFKHSIVWHLKEIKEIKRHDVNDAKSNKALFFFGSEKFFFSKQAMIDISRSTLPLKI